MPWIRYNATSKYYEQAAVEGGAYSKLDLSGHSEFALLAAATNKFDGMLGVGVVPAFPLDVYRSADGFNTVAIRSYGQSSGSYTQLLLNAYGNSWGMRMGSIAANGNSLELILDYTAPVIKAILDTSGNFWTAGFHIAPGGYKERARTALMGDWTSLAYANLTFTSGAGTWTVDAGDLSFLRYALVGKTVFINGMIATSTTNGCLTALIIGGLPFTIAYYGHGHLIYQVGGVWGTGTCQLAGGTSSIYLYNNNVSNWANGTNNVYLYFTAFAEIN